MLGIERVTAAHSCWTDEQVTAIIDQWHQKRGPSVDESRNKGGAPGVFEAGLRTRHNPSWALNVQA